LSQKQKNLQAAPSNDVTSPALPVGAGSSRAVIGVCVLLVAAVWLVFGQTLRYDFVDFDDNRYVTENPVVQKGLTGEGFRWALTYGDIGHWHPLTWLSHMLDCQLYGLNASGHHLTNVLLHTASVILLFLVLRRMMGLRPEKGIGAATPQAGCLWRSALVAAVFAIHPLRVESVAWVAERKDVLSALFFILTLWAYVRYVEKFKAQSSKFKVYYGLTLLFFALGLLSKNMLVTTPFVLLLLDYWPLGRLSNFAPQVLLRLVAEKIPLFVLTVGSCVATFLTPEKVTVTCHLPFGLRLENAVVSCVTYLWQMICPSGLACVYPNPTNYLPVWQVVGAVGVLLAISGAVWAFRKTCPHLIVGWLWYLGMMIPVVGLVQISYYAHADRYTYLPQIGLYLSLAWAAADLCAGWRCRRVVLGGGAAIILMALIFCARAQTAYWRNSESLWAHTLGCTSDNFIGQNGLGNALLKKGSVDEAIFHYQKALQIVPGNPEVCYNLGNALLKKDNVDEAIAQYQKALQIKSDYVEACNNLGKALFKKGNVEEAIAHYQKALQIKPDNAEIRNNLAVALAKAHGDHANTLVQMGRDDEAIVEFRKALELFPDFADARHDLAVILLHKGQVDEAIAQFREIQKKYPDDAMASFDLGNACFQKGQLDEAVGSYQRALQIKPDDVSVRNNLGMALLKKGMVDEAVVQFRAALALQPDFALARTNLDKALRQKEHP
jgi:tetratricopeptide (TPR) repeat protein